MRIGQLCRTQLKIVLIGAAQHNLECTSQFAQLRETRCPGNAPQRMRQTEALVRLRLVCHRVRAGKLVNQRLRRSPGLTDKDVE